MEPKMKYNCIPKSSWSWAVSPEKDKPPLYVLHVCIIHRYLFTDNNTPNVMVIYEYIGEVFLVQFNTLPYIHTTSMAEVCLTIFPYKFDDCVVCEQLLIKHTARRSRILILPLPIQRRSKPLKPHRPHPRVGGCGGWGVGVGVGGRGGGEGGGAFY